MATTSLIPLNYVLIEEFLPNHINKHIYSSIISSQGDFIPSFAYRKSSSYRRSKVLFANYLEEKGIVNIFEAEIMKKLPNILEALHIPQFEVTQFECQCTASNNGDYYRLHNDHGNLEVENRALSYVYYFSYPDPPNFTGGELVLYETDLLNNFASNYQDDLSPSISITPKNNSIILFDSRMTHEVREVKCDSRKFEDSRFTINGWIRK